MKTILFAAALCTSSIALAQDIPSSAPDNAIEAEIPADSGTADTIGATPPAASAQLGDAIQSDSDPADAAMTNTTDVTETYTGQGGPLEAPDYPLCTRTVTDSCLQTRNSPKPPRS